MLTIEKYIKDISKVVIELFTDLVFRKPFFLLLLLTEPLMPLEDKALPAGGVTKNHVLFVCNYTDEQQQQGC